MGVVHVTRAVLPGMRGLPAGRIVNIASTASLKGYAYTSAYTASKPAVPGVTRALALELAGTGLPVNAICPRHHDTDIIRNSRTTLDRKKGRSEQAPRKTFTGTNPPAPRN